MPGTVLHRDGVTPVQKPRRPSDLATSLVCAQILLWGDCWILVLIKSKGCSSTVEQAPLRAPARNDVSREVDFVEFFWGEEISDLASIKFWSCSVSLCSFNIGEVG